ncbi:DegT/DnrJ/EryC1/StrS family aminotransferase [Chelativorans sp. YIM 93263]|uniref:DegT/DnrJ/EryC1/StrS family aminotransferase n=1 Tax=Chelativorans sp. YIM 93263 TaxID=2906648 RepID=UPI0023780EBA|nr:DegT/DnrJ/EryC1/StrS aminotransferase family protein [Chelativorans sp. YIM 93263]
MPASKLSPWPSFSQEEAEAVADVLLSNKVNYWTGDACKKFEAAFAKRMGTEYAVSLMNGTVALELALRALGVGPGDDVVTTPRTFIASASAAVSVGANPVFADIDRDTQNITADTIAQVITPRTKAIICVHLAGMPCEMDAIMSLANSKGIVVIEDCAQAHGALYKGRSVGSIGHIGAWSFCQDKIMTTGGEGGMVTTNDKDLWEFMWSYKDHGKTWEAVYERQHPPGPRLVHDRFGTNWRMLEMQAAIGLIQLERLEGWRESRAKNAALLSDTCRKFPCMRVPSVPEHITHAHYRFYAFVEPQALAAGWTRDRIIAELNSQGIPCLHGSHSEIYREQAFNNTGWCPSDRLPVAKELGETSIAFLVHPTLTSADMEKITSALSEILGRASAE